MPIATATVGPPDPNRPPNNPFYLEAEAHAASGDTEALRALDQRLDVAGYHRDGKIRKRIAELLEGM